MTAGTEQVAVRPFASVSAVQSSGPGRFLAELDDRWTVAGKPNGGYLLGTMARAAVLTVEHDHVIAAGATYLRSPEPGPVVIETDVLRAGRSASQVRVRLLQDGSGCVEATVTVGDFDPSVVPYWDRGLPEPGTSRFEDCVRLVPSDAGLPVAIMEQVEVRLEPESYRFASGRPSGRGELRGWLQLPEAEPFDAMSLLYAVDALPPATLDIERAGWVPTLALTVYVRALPAPGPVRVLQRAQLVDGGRVDEACFVWDRTGRLVAQGTQLALIRLG